MLTSDGAPPPVITYDAHPGHVLKLVVATTGAGGTTLFKCDGCKQLGTDDECRYRCDPCDFDLHLCCAPLNRAQLLLTHPLFPGRVFVFLRSPPAVPPGCLGSGRICDACGDPVLGFLYHDAGRQLDLHPQCAHLPERAVDEDDGGPGVVELYMAAPVGHGSSCGLCGKGQGCPRARFWCYSYRVQGGGEPRYLHVACLMEAAYSRAQMSSTRSTLVAPQVSAPAAAGSSWQQAAAGSSWQQVSAPAAGGWQQVSAPAAGHGEAKFKSFCKIALDIANLTWSIASLDPVGAFDALNSM